MKISSPEYDPGDAVWRKSSYSGGEGGNCLEVATSSKSARSGAGGGCLDAAADRPGAVPVRDSKDPDGPKLVFRTAAWSAFVDGVSDAPQTGR